MVPQPDNDDVQWIPADRMIRDERVNTRPVDTGWVARHVPVYDRRAVAALTVSARPRNQFVILDGQNRRELAQTVEGPRVLLPSRVMRGLSLQEEAALFRMLNDRRGVLAVYQFLARVTEGDQAAAIISKTAEAAGWRISKSGGEGQITAVASLEKIYNGDRIKGDGENLEALALTLQTVTAAWGFDRHAVNGDLLLGVGYVFLRHGRAVNTEHLVRKLAGTPGGPTGLIGHARGLRDFFGGSVAHSVAGAVVARYNVGLRSNALPEWRKKAE